MVIFFKYTWLIFMITNFMINYSTVSVPKSSLEAVKTEIESDLQVAIKQKNLKLIKKYQTELDNIKIKIKKFEHDWLNYKKRKLLTKTVQNNNIQTEITEIEELLKNYV